MTGTLALVGGGEFTSACTFDRSLIDAAASTEVIVIPTAAAYEHPSRLVDAATTYFEPLGVTARGLDVLSRPQAMDPANAEIVRNATFIYLVGGSSMHARSVLMQSPVWDALTEAWSNGATVAGSSAGGQVLCDPMVDSRGGAFTLGLGLINDVAVIPHRELWSEDALHRTRVLSAPDLVLLGVDESTAAIRSPDGSWRAEGAGEVVLNIGGHPSALADLVR